MLEQIEKNSIMKKRHLTLYLRFDTPKSAKSDLLLPKPYIMPRKAFIEAERAHCVIWMTEVYVATAFQRLFWDVYSRTPRDRSTVRLWWADYQELGTHTQRGGNGLPQISVRTRNRIRQLFEDNLLISLHAASAETSVAYAAIWTFFTKIIRAFPLQAANNYIANGKS